MQYKWLIAVNNYYIIFDLVNLKYNIVSSKLNYTVNILLHRGAKKWEMT